jgi:hypothetical protein
MARHAKAAVRTSPKTALRAHMEKAIEEFIHAQNMDPKDLLDYVRQEQPGALFPPMVEGIILTIAGDRSLSLWARTAREGNQSLKKKTTSKSWESAVKKSFIAAVREVSASSSDDDAATWFSTRVMEFAEESVRENELVITHYIPCFLFDDPAAGEFAVGPIALFPGRQLPARVEKELGAKPQWMAEYLAVVARSKNHEKNQNRKTHHNASAMRKMSGFPWVAAVRLDRHEPQMSQKLATDCVRLVVAGLALMAPPNRCADLGLAYEWGRPREIESMMQVPGKDIVCGFRSNRPQIGGRADWVKDFLSSQRPYLDWLGASISSVLLNESLPACCRVLRESWLNALYWYYVGGSEVSDARATICYSSCLESLSNGDGTDSILRLCEALFDVDRTAVLVPATQLTLGDAVTDIYNMARSEVVHGGRFVLAHEYETERALAAQLSRIALFRFQECLVTFEQKYGDRAESNRKDVYEKWLDARRRRAAAL